MITDKKTTTKVHATIKLGIDAHAKWYYVARQVDGATPQPVQKMDLDGLLHFVAKQQRLAREVGMSINTLNTWVLVYNQYGAGSALFRAGSASPRARGDGGAAPWSPGSAAST